MLLRGNLFFAGLPFSIKDGEGEGVICRVFLVLSGSQNPRVLEGNSTGGNITHCFLGS